LPPIKNNNSLLKLENKIYLGPSTMKKKDDYKSYYTSMLKPTLANPIYSKIV